MTINVMDMGADNTGKKLSTNAIQQAINSCQQGGCVYVPKGKYISGALFLKSDMTLRIEKGAEILGSSNSDDFPIRIYRWEGEEKECYSSLINAGKTGEKLFNLTIEGGGVINANGEELFKKEMSEKKGARGRAVCITGAENLTIRGITLRQSPSWCLHLIECRDIVIDEVEIYTKCDENGRRYKDIFNGDGIDLDSCVNVEVKNSLIASQDDCIAIKSGKDEEGRLRGKPSENIKIRNCIFKSGFGIGIGSEMSGGLRNVEVRDCEFTDTVCLGNVKTCRGRGNVIENILFENVKLVNRDPEFTDCKWFRGAINIDCYYSIPKVSKIKEPVNEGTPAIRNVTFRNAEVDTIAGNAIYICGLPEMHCENIVLENVTAAGKFGMKAYFADGLAMKNVTVEAKEGDAKVFEEVSFA